jgi:CheY-like chemotaxis protein
MPLAIACPTPQLLVVSVERLKPGRPSALLTADPPAEAAALGDPLKPSAALLVLIVDDDEDWRVLGTMLLKRLGFEVIEASDAFEAMLRFLGGGVDVVLTDVFMPGTDGVELIRGLRSIDPELPIVAFTAAVEPQLCAQSCGHHVPLLAKPLQLRQLEAAIRTSLESRT